MRPIWMVSRGYPPEIGGVQSYARAVAIAYTELGHDVIMFASSSAGPRPLVSGRLTVRDVGKASKIVVHARLAAAMIHQWSTGGAPLLIHACTWRSAIAALLLPARLIVTVHGREIGRPRGAALLLMRAILRRAERIVAVSETTRALLVRRLPWSGPKCMISFNGLSLAVGAPRDRSCGQGRIELLTACRLVPRKNIGTAIAAVAACAVVGRPIRYRIAGDGPESENLHCHIEQLGVGGNVTMLGNVDTKALHHLYEGSQIFLHPQIALEGGSEIEGFGISVADAMGHGLVCIVGREGGPSELVEDGRTGFVVDGHATSEITSLLDRLAADPSLCRSIGQAARAWVCANLSWTSHCLACLR